MANGPYGPPRSGNQLFGGVFQGIGDILSEKRKQDAARKQWEDELTTNLMTRELDNPERTPGERSQLMQLILERHKVKPEMAQTIMNMMPKDVMSQAVPAQEEQLPTGGFNLTPQGLTHTDVTPGQHAVAAVPSRPLTQGEIAAKRQMDEQIAGQIAMRKALKPFQEEEEQRQFEQKKALTQITADATTGRALALAKLRGQLAVDKPLQQALQSYRAANPMASEDDALLAVGQQQQGTLRLKDEDIQSRINARTAMEGHLKNMDAISAQRITQGQARINLLAAGNIRQAAQQKFDAAKQNLTNLRSRLGELISESNLLLAKLNNPSIYMSEAQKQADRDRLNQVDNEVKSKTDYEIPEAQKALDAIASQTAATAASTSGAGGGGGQASYPPLRADSGPGIYMGKNGKLFKVDSNPTGKQPVGHALP